MTAQPNNRFVFCVVVVEFCCKLKPGLRLLFVLTMGHTLLRMFLNIWGQILFPGDLMMMLISISAQLSVEPLIAHAVCNSQHASVLISVLLLN